MGGKWPAQQTARFRRIERLGAISADYPPKVAQRLPMCDDVLIFAIGRKRRCGKLLREVPATKESFSFRLDPFVCA
jgi:hypothetical protein